MARGAHGHAAASTPPGHETGGSERSEFTDMLYARLRQDILDDVYSPGKALLETTLSSQYGVSRTPVREALGRLSQDGLVERTPRGFVVKRRSPEEVLEIYEARIALESRIAELAAERRSDFDLARLTHLTGLRRDATDPRQLGQLDKSWHEALWRSAHNATMTDLLHRVDSLLLLYRPHIAVPATDKQSADEHEAILSAIVRNDDRAAGSAMTDHLSRMRDLRIQAFLLREI